MIRNLTIAVCLFLCSDVAGLGQEASLPEQPSELQGNDRDATRPNIIFVLADDLGWTELGCYGNGFNETPNLNRLASGGMRFTQAYAAAPVCSPYRAAFLVGQHPARIGILDYLRPNSANALSVSHDTLPEVLKRNTYATGMIGKWHLTGYTYHDAEHEIKPKDHGFTWDIAREVKGVGNGANFWPYVFRTQPIRWLDVSDNRLGPNEFLVDRMNLEAVEFIERNKDQPFFLYLSHYAPHTIMNGKPALVEKYRKKHKPGASSRERCYLCQDHGHAGDTLNHWAGDHNPHLAAMLESIDDGIGLIRAKLDELGLSKNTIIIFSSDNGGETSVTSNDPLRGGKSQLYEGGIRVPLLVHWPGKVPAGSLCTQPTMNIDFYPTLLEAANIDRDSNHTLDGVSTLDTWMDPTVPINRTSLFWHYPLDRPHFLGGTSSGAIRADGWKLIEDFNTGNSELYRLDDDTSEQVDLSNDRPEVVLALKTKLNDWRESVGARIPSPPLLTETRKLYFADHFSPNQVSTRWAFSKDWFAENGTLRCGVTGSKTSRIFLKGAQYKNVVIRFDFQFQRAHDIRLVTGGNGSYNAVLHIHRDHFFLQTALDKSGPYFPYRHGECKFAFSPDRWYTMTIEIIGDQLVAHVDPDHVVYAKHPILDQERGYLAFQVDASAQFDNIQVLTATRHRKQVENLKRLQSVVGRYPVEKTVEDQYSVQKTNAHEWFYRRDAAYRDLVRRVDDLDNKKKELYPAVFRSHKEIRKAISTRRLRLREEDPKYKEMLFSTYRATRALDAFLIARQPDVADLPDSRRLQEIERLRLRFRRDARYQKLNDHRNTVQKVLEVSYPQLFLTNDQISESRKQQRIRFENEPEFKKLLGERAAAWRAQQEYLVSHDNKLADLMRRLGK